MAIILIMITNTYPGYCSLHLVIITKRCNKKQTKHNYNYNHSSNNNNNNNCNDNDNGHSSHWSKIYN